MKIKVNVEIIDKESIVKRGPLDIDVETQYSPENLWLIVKLKNEESPTVRKVLYIMTGRLEIEHNYNFECTIVQVLHNNSLHFIITGFVQSHNNEFVLKNISTVFSEEINDYILFNYDEVLEVLPGINGQSILTCVRMLVKNGLKNSFWYCIPQ
jgi:hypothetical protein